jgi:AmmeMemoRadiSam system protein A
MAEVTCTLTLEDGLRLARWVRSCAASLLETGHIGGERPVGDGRRFGGMFVTFWNGDRLRGCVGSFDPTDDLFAKAEAVTASALADRRFQDNPISRAELDSCDIDVSVLTELMKSDNPLALGIGRDGIVVRKGNSSGCFLPKVAVEKNWSPEEFLANCCVMKAGLPADAWQAEDAEVFTFSSQVFQDASPLRGS